MTEKEKKYLSDILTSLHHIQSLTIDIQFFEDYKKNFLVKSAVERHLTIVGEQADLGDRQATFTSPSRRNQGIARKKLSWM